MNDIYRSIIFPNIIGNSYANTHTHPVSKSHD